MEKLFQLLSVCYRYNRHNYKIYIPIITQNPDDTLLIYKLQHGYNFKIMGYSTHLPFNDVETTIKRFFNTIPYNPETCYIDFENFGEFSKNYKIYCEIEDFI